MCIRDSISISYKLKKWKIEHSRTQSNKNNNRNNRNNWDILVNFDWCSIMFGNRTPIIRLCSIDFECFNWFFCSIAFDWHRLGKANMHVRTYVHLNLIHRKGSANENWMYNLTVPENDIPILITGIYSASYPLAPVKLIGKKDYLNL